jgi:DNA-3-methyladenine glycosylase I
MTKRCTWCGDDPQYQQYHDTEWGIPQKDDRVLFEFLILESAQAGLSWITVLRKREAYSKAFAAFDYRKVALFSEQDIEQRLNDPGIIRNRLKITAAVNNAQRFIEVQKEFGSFAQYLWGWVDNKPIQNRYTALSELPASTELSAALCKDLKKRGFKFLGGNIMYAYMQAMGLVNDHMSNCPSYKIAAKAGKHFSL